jgi:hypothetical protein
MLPCDHSFAPATTIRWPDLPVGTGGLSERVTGEAILRRSRTVRWKTSRRELHMCCPQRQDRLRVRERFRLYEKPGHYGIFNRLRRATSQRHQQKSRVRQSGTSCRRANHYRFFSPPTHVHSAEQKRPLCEVPKRLVASLLQA